ncbi:MAG: hypothetical protein ABIS17_11835 [Casimicrobiaceae bacterium]
MSIVEYCAWFRDVIHDFGLAEDVVRIEPDPALDASASRKGMVDVVSERYMAPARGS